MQRYLTLPTFIDWLQSTVIHCSTFSIMKHNFSIWKSTLPEHIYPFILLYLNIFLVFLHQTLHLFLKLSTHGFFLYIFLFQQFSPLKKLKSKKISFKFMENWTYILKQTEKCFVRYFVTRKPVSFVILCHIICWKFIITI